MQRALYGPDGFYRAGGGPAAHFRTSVHASPLFATAITRLLLETDEALGRPPELALIDVGAGRGELLEAVHAQLATELDVIKRPDVINRLRLIAVELADRPDNRTSAIEWRNDLPDPGSVTGLLVANEWLDNVPCDVVQATPDGWRLVEVATASPEPPVTERPGTEGPGTGCLHTERTGTGHLHAVRPGTERLSAVPNPAQQAWLSTWWPPDAAHDPSSDPASEPSPDPSGVPARAEIGLSRDAAWRDAVAVLARGVAVAVDYAHVRTSRPLFGTLTGYAHGRQVAPVPDGSCDITAHVALDSCAAAADAEWTIQSDQRTVLHSLGITGARPDLTLASSDPRGYLRALSQASAAAELTDPAGLGGFGWLVQGVGVPIPPSLVSRLT